MAFIETTSRKHRESVLSTNDVLRNTYILLGFTLLFSSLTAGLALITHAPPLNVWLTLIVYLGLLFLTSGLRNSPWGIASVFALTGFLGYTLGPILGHYLNTFTNGSQLVMMSLGTTGLVFFGLSAYALTTRKDFSFMSSFIMIGLVVAFVMGLTNLFFQVPVLALVTSAMFVFLSSGIILVQTSQIIHGGETNYIMATVTLYVSLYNIFVSLLNLLGAFSGNRD